MNYRLQQFLSAENLSQAQFADIIGVARASVSHIIAGRNKPGFDFIYSMAASFPNLNVEWLVTGCDAADPERGFFTSDLSVSNLERESVTIADHVVVVTTSEKFALRAFVKFADFSDIDMLVTDSQLAPALANQLKKRGLEVIRASCEE